jgi:hypothetical protein
MADVDSPCDGVRWKVLVALVFAVMACIAVNCRFTDILDRDAPANANAIRNTTIFHLQSGPLRVETTFKATIPLRTPTPQEILAGAANQTVQCVFVYDSTPRPSDGYGGKLTRPASATIMPDANTKQDALFVQCKAPTSFPFPGKCHRAACKYDVVITTGGGKTKIATVIFTQYNLCTSRVPGSCENSDVAAVYATYWSYRRHDKIVAIFGSNLAYLPDITCTFNSTTGSAQESRPIIRGASPTVLEFTNIVEEPVMTRCKSNGQRFDLFPISTSEYLDLHPSILHHLHLHLEDSHNLTWLATAIISHVSWLLLVGFLLVPEDRKFWACSGTLIVLLLLCWAFLWSEHEAYKPYAYGPVLSLHLAALGLAVVR